MKAKVKQIDGYKVDAKLKCPFCGKPISRSNWPRGVEMSKNTWRPQSFDAGAIAAKVLQGRGITNPVYWASSVMCALVEAGADAVIYPQSIIGIDFSLLNHMSDSLQAKHFALCNDPPAVKAEPQLMICPKAKECPFELLSLHPNCWHRVEHIHTGKSTDKKYSGACPDCIPVFLGFDFGNFIDKKYSGACPDCIPHQEQPLTNNQEWCPQHGYPLPCPKCGNQSEIHSLKQPRLNHEVPNVTVGSLSPSQPLDEQPKEQSETYWWCPECEEEVAPSRVTFQVCHDTCGTHVIAKPVPPPSPPLDEGLLPDEVCAECETYKGFNCQICYGNMGKLLAKVQPKLAKLQARIKELEEADNRKVWIAEMNDEVAEAKAEEDKEIGENMMRHVRLEPELPPRWVANMIAKLKSGKSPREVRNE